MKKRLRVAIVSESFSYTSGVGEVIRTLIKFFRLMDIKIILIGPKHPGSEKWGVQECLWLPSKVMKSRGYCRTEIISPKNSELIVNILSDIDIVFCESISTLVLRVMLLRWSGRIDCKIIFHAHTMADRYLEAWYGKILAWPLNTFLIKPITWFCLCVADVRIAPSSFFADHLKEMQWCKKRINVWSAPIKIPDNLPDLSKTEAGQLVIEFKKGHEFVLVANGRVGNEKCSFGLIKLTLLLRKKGIDVGLVFVGGGEIEFFKRKIPISYIEHFLFTDKLDREEGIAINALCDVGIAMSTTDTQSLSFLEQMAMGLPMVARGNTVMARYIYESDCGVVMPDIGLNDMAGCLAEFLKERKYFNIDSRKTKKYISNNFSEKLQLRLLKNILYPYQFKL